MNGYSEGLPPCSRTATQTMHIKDEWIGGKHLKVHIYKLINIKKNLKHVFEVEVGISLLII
jgi:hypothetical protein